MIFGGSGGGAAVAGHLTMPGSWGLYHAAGMDSPGVLKTCGLRDSKSWGFSGYDWMVVSILIFFLPQQWKIVQDAVFCFNHNRNGHVQAMKHNEKYDIHEMVMNFLQFYSVWAWYQVMPWLLPCAFVPRRPSGMARSKWSTSSAKRWLDVAIFGRQQLLWLCCQPMIEHQTLLDPVVRSYTDFSRISGEEMITKEP